MLKIAQNEHPVIDCYQSSHAMIYVYYDKLYNIDIDAEFIVADGYEWWLVLIDVIDEYF